MFVGWTSALGAIVVMTAQQSAPQAELHPETLQKKQIEPVAPLQRKIESIPASKVSTSSLIGGGSAERLSATQAISVSTALIATESDLSGARSLRLSSRRMFAIQARYRNHTL